MSIYRNILIIKTNPVIEIDQGCVITAALLKHFGVTEAILLNTETGIQAIKYETETLPGLYGQDGIKGKLKDFQEDTVDVVKHILFAEPRGGDDLYSFFSADDHDLDAVNECAVFVLEAAIKTIKENGVSIL